MRTKVRGVSILEILTVIAIAAIIGAIAVPNYKGYSVRSKISKVFKIADVHKAKFNEYYLAHGGPPSTISLLHTDDASMADYPDINGVWIHGLDNNTIGYTLNLSSLGLDATKSLDLRFTFTDNSDTNNSFTWACTVWGEQDYMQYFPSDCTYSGGDT